jgi:hypothetical protein
MQETPKVSRNDVEQIVRRDFPAERFAEVMAILDEVKKDTEDARVRFQLHLVEFSFGKIEFLRRLMPTISKAAPDDVKKFVNQPVPKVTKKHVERIVHRDFPAEQFADVMAILGEYGKENWQPEVERVQLDVLKLANGKMDVLRKRIEDAKSDYRDVISWAEYPNCRWDTSNLPAEEQKQIYAKDWKQYLDWANAK